MCKRDTYTQFIVMTMKNTVSFQGALLKNYSSANSRKFHRKLENCSFKKVKFAYIFIVI